MSNQPNETEPPDGRTSPASTDPHSKLFASWLKLMAIPDPQARAKGMSALAEQIKHIEQSNKGKDSE